MLKKLLYAVLLVLSTTLGALIADWILFQTLPPLPPPLVITPQGLRFA